MTTTARSLAPDLILHGGRIHTLEAHDTVVDALAIKDGRIVAAGSDGAILPFAVETSKMAQPGQASSPFVQLIDLEGRTVIPGIMDAHNHLLEVGTKLSWVRLDECRSPEEMASLVRERALVTPPGQWIIGQGWSEGNFPGGRLPARSDIDHATADHPVILMRFFNTDLVNSHALRLAAIDAGGGGITADPPGGKIERDSLGQPTGLLRGAAKALVRHLLPRPTPRQLHDALTLACAEMSRLGITSVVEPGLYPYEIAAYQEFRRSGGLTVRTSLMPNWHGFRDEESEELLDSRAAGLGMMTGFGDEWLRLGALKMAIDGGTSPHTAYMYEPYEGETEMTAFLRLSVDRLRRYLMTAQELGWDVGIHCCGDRAQDIAVQALTSAMTAHPRPDARHSIIHAYFPTSGSLRLMSEHNIAAVIQPTFLHYEGTLIYRDVGFARAQNYKPARKYLDAGVPLASSSDVTSTVSADPFRAIYSLVTRRNAEGDEIAPHEAISRAEALRTYTTAGAWLTREENLKGTLEPGKLADLVVLDRDLFAVPDEEIRNVSPVLTMVGGRVVFDGGVLSQP